MFHVQRFDVTRNLEKFWVLESKALYSSKNFWKIDTVAFSFVFDKYCQIMD